ncbi:unnamed protein product, partial [Larinioides sclopetarius]
NRYRITFYKSQERKSFNTREASLTLNPVLGVCIGVIVAVVVISTIIITIIKSRRSKSSYQKETSITDEKFICEMEKKELEESQDTSGKGPDIIPLPKDPEVFHLEGYLEDVHRSECLQKQDSPPTEYIRLKYMHTVL